MIRITSIRNAPTQGEVWAIVRSLKSSKPNWTQVTELSPSWDLFKNYHILFWWFTESVTIVFGTFLFILAKNSFERSHPIDQLNDITFIIIILIIAVISMVILLIDFPGVLGDLLFTIPMALAASFITMGIALLFVLAGGLSWMEKLEFFFTGPNSIPYLTAYIVLILIFF